MILTTNYTKNKIQHLDTGYLKVHVFLFFILLTGLISTSFAQPINESVHYINYGINDGLPSSETYDVFQDSKGYLWIGTDNGVVRYDGTNFEIFTTLDGLTDNTVFNIKEDSQGRVWFITHNRKLCYFENDKFHPYWFNNELSTASKSFFEGFTITGFEIDSTNHVFLTFIDFSTLEIDNKGKTSFRKVGKVNQISTYTELLNSKNVDALIKNANPFLNKLPTMVKLRTRTKKFGVVHLYKNDSITYLGYKNGIITSNNVSGEIISHKLSNYYVTSFEIDNEGNHWYSTLFNGLFYIPNWNINVFKLSNGSAKNHIHGIIPYDKGLVFCFGKNDNFFQIKMNASKLEPFKNELDYSKIHASSLNLGLKLENPISFKDVYTPSTSVLALNNTTTLFCGSFLTTLSSIEEQSKINTYSSPELQLKNPYLDYKNRKWNLCEDGIYHKKGDSIILNRFLPPFPHKILKLYKDYSNTIWAGSPNGLYTLDPISQEFIKTHQSHPFTNYRIQDIIQTKDSSLFYGTKAHGIFILKNNKVSEINLDSGLLSNTVHQIIYDTNTNIIWVATNNGVSQLNQTKSGKWVPKSMITKYDALASIDIRQLAIFDNHLFMANNTGVSKIKLKHLNKKLPPPYLYINAVTANSKPIPVNGSVKSLEYDSNTIAISYKGIAFKSMNDIEYTYKLTPIQNDWQTTKNTEVVFPALPAGDYEFIVKAKNIQGIESLQKSFKFRILPAFWMTWWFKTVMVIILSYLLFIGVKKIISRYKAQAHFQKTLKEMQFMSLQSKMNPHFIFNSLNSIQNFILKNEKDEANAYLMEFSQLIRKTLQRSDSPTILLSEELETLQMYIDLEKRRLRNGFEYATEIDSKIDLANCEIPSLLIQPYIENSIWHGKIHTVENGLIVLKISLFMDSLNFEIQDNGIGIAASLKSKVSATPIKHQSLANSITDKRIKILSDLNSELSKVTITNAFSESNTNPNLGTLVSFSIPYKLKTKQ